MFVPVPYGGGPSGAPTAAYRNELAKLCDAAAELVAEMPPDEAMRTWMDRFIDYLATKRGMADALRAVIASGSNPYAQSRDRLLGAIGTLLDAGAATGVLRRDVPPEDVLTGVNGICLAAGEAAQREQAGRLLDLLMDGLRRGRRARRPEQRACGTHTRCQRASAKQ